MARRERRSNIRAWVRYGRIWIEENGGDGRKRERSWWMGRERREGEGRIVKRGEEREKD